MAKEKTSVPSSGAGNRNMMRNLGYVILSSIFFTLLFTVSAAATYVFWPAVFANYTAQLMAYPIVQTVLNSAIVAKTLAALNISLTANSFWWVPISAGLLGSAMAATNSLFYLSYEAGFEFVNWCRNYFSVGTDSDDQPEPDIEINNNEERRTLNEKEEVTDESMNLGKNPAPGEQKSPLGEHETAPDAQQKPAPGESRSTPSEKPAPEEEEKSSSINSFVPNQSSSSGSKTVIRQKNNTGDVSSLRRPKKRVRPTVINFFSEKGDKGTTTNTGKELENIENNVRSGYHSH